MSLTELREQNMSPAQPDAYDEVTYPNFAYPQTHPDRLASLATLFGMNPPPAERCRVLELACGNGGNLIPMAFTLPESQFVGIDRATQPILKGRSTIAALGLNNIELRQLDVNEAGSQLGRFDYIIAHGLYSWVPPDVRDQILNIFRSCLNPQGVGFLSYNTYPGCHLRRITRDVLLFHTRDAKNTQERVTQARALINWLADSQSGANAYQMFLSEARQNFDQKSDAAIYHDDLAEINSPVYLHQFVEHAAQHGLQFISEAEYFDVQYSQFPVNVCEQLRLLGEQDVLAKEQYLDFLEGRSFRQTLLAHHEIQLDRVIPPARVHNFYLRAEVRPLSANPDLGPEAVEEFRGKKESAIATSLGLGKAALLCLGETYPRSVGFDALLAQASSRINSSATAEGAVPNHDANLLIAQDRSQTIDPGDAAMLESLLLKAHGAGVIEMHLHDPTFTLEPGERPIANPLARLQAREGPIITTLLHNNIKLEDDLGRQLLLLLDGTRNRAELLEELRTIIASGFGTGSDDAQTADRKQNFLRTLPEELEEKLGLLGRLGLLLA